MKLKNVKYGQRVQHKGSVDRPELIGALGTVREVGSIMPYVEWDNDEHNRTTHEGYRVGVAYVLNLRKVT